MPKKLSPPPKVPLFTDNTNLDLHPEWAEFFEQFTTMAATQTDASTVSDPPTQAEVNAIVTVINALIDKLQAANLME